MRTTVAFCLTSFAVIGAGCARETIAHEQDERSAHRIISLLYTEGSIEAQQIKVEKAKIPAFDIAVLASERQRALSVLERYNLPAEKKQDTCALLMDDSSLIPTPERDRAKSVCGISGDITNKLRRVERVVDATAVVSIPPKEIDLDPSEPRARPSASVILSFIPDANGDAPLSAEEVQRFAAAAVPNIAAKDVFVRMVEVGNAPLVAAAPTCVKAEVLGVLICAEHRGRLASLVLAAICVSGFFAALMLIAILRAFRYRKELTRLTATAATASTAS